MYTLDTTHNKTCNIYALDTTQPQNTNHHPMSGIWRHRFLRSNPYDYRLLWLMNDNFY